MSDSSVKSEIKAETHEDIFYSTPENLIEEKNEDEVEEKNKLQQHNVKEEGVLEEGETESFSRSTGPDRSYRDHKNEKISTAPYQRLSEKDHSDNNPKDLAKDQPTHTLFVRNIHYDVSDSKLRSLFQEHGEIKRFFTSLVQTRGIAFISFFDIRNTMKAKESLHGYLLSNRNVEVYYAIPAPNDKTKASFEDRENDGNSGSLNIYINNLQTGSQVSVEEIGKYFEKFGEIRNVKSQSNKERTFLIEFFDLRACQKALDECNGKKYKGGTFEIKFSYPPKSKDMSNPKSNRDRKDDKNRSGRSSGSRNTSNNIGVNNDRYNSRDSHRSDFSRYENYSSSRSDSDHGKNERRNASNNRGGRSKYSRDDRGNISKSKGKQTGFSNGPSGNNNQFQHSGFPNQAQPNFPNQMPPNFNNGMFPNQQGMNPNQIPFQPGNQQHWQQMQSGGYPNQFFPNQGFSNNQGYPPNFSAQPNQGNPPNFSAQPNQGNQGMNFSGNQQSPWPSNPPFQNQNFPTNFPQNPSFQNQFQNQFNPNNVPSFPQNFQNSPIPNFQNQSSGPQILSTNQLQKLNELIGLLKPTGK